MVVLLALALLRDVPVLDDKPRPPLELPRQLLVRVLEVLPKDTGSGRLAEDTCGPARCRGQTGDTATGCSLTRITKDAAQPV